MFIIKTQDKYVDLSKKWVKKVDDKDDATRFENRVDAKSVIDKLKDYGYSEIKLEEVI